jgi:hypothetical protein
MEYGIAREPDTADNNNGMIVEVEVRPRGGKSSMKQAAEYLAETRWPVPLRLQDSPLVMQAAVCLARLLSMVR